MALWCCGLQAQQILHNSRKEIPDLFANVPPDSSCSSSPLLLDNYVSSQISPEISSLHSTLLNSPEHTNSGNVERMSAGDTELLIFIKHWHTEQSFMEQLADIILSLSIMCSDPDTRSSFIHSQILSVMIQYWTEDRSFVWCNDWDQQIIYSERKPRSQTSRSNSLEYLTTFTSCTPPPPLTWEHCEHHGWPRSVEREAVMKRYTVTMKLLIVTRSTCPGQPFNQCCGEYL